MKADAASGNQTEIFTMEGHQSQNRRKRKISGTCYDPGMDLFFFLLQPFGITERVRWLFDFTVVLFYDRVFYCLNFYLGCVDTDSKDCRE